MLLPGLPKRRNPLLIWGVSAASAVALTGAIAIPIVAQPADPRNGNIPVAIDALSDPGLYNEPVLVSADAPLNVFGGSGKELAIDGRPLGMVEGADESSESDEAGSEEANTLLAGEVGQIGELPGGLQLMHPVTTRSISSPYGWRSNPTGAGNQIHIGQDYPIACGSPVYASEAGTVVVSGWAGHSGNRVTIDHGNNVQTGYSHNSKLIAKVGQQVQQGELIALAGTTGNSTGCHVHFEVIIDGRWHDPRNYLPVIPGQRQAMIDSSRLTVNAGSAPKGGGSTPAVRDRDDTSSNPDVVVPKDDTPVVPKPKPKPSVKPKPVELSKPSQKPSDSPSPSESESGKPSGSPSQSPSEKPSETPSKSPKPSQTQKPTSPNPDESKDSSQPPSSSSTDQESEKISSESPSGTSSSSSSQSSSAKSSSSSSGSASATSTN